MCVSKSYDDKLCVSEREATGGGGRRRRRRTGCRTKNKNPTQRCGELYIEDMAVARKSVGKKPSWLAFHTGGQTSWTCGPIISCSRGMLPVQASCSNLNPKSFKIAVGGPSKYDCKA